MDTQLRRPYHADVPIIGAGPDRFDRAHHADFRGLSVSVMDPLPVPGGQASTRHPAKATDDTGRF